MCHCCWFCCYLKRLLPQKNSLMGPVSMLARPRMSRIKHTKNQCVHRHKQASSECYPFIPCSWKLPHFLVGLRKHFRYVMPAPSAKRYKYSALFSKNKKNSHRKSRRLQYEDSLCIEGVILLRVGLSTLFVRFQRTFLPLSSACYRGIRSRRHSIRPRYRDSVQLVCPAHYYAPFRTWRVG